VRKKEKPRTTDPGFFDQVSRNKSHGPQEAAEASHERRLSVQRDGEDEAGCVRVE
jgi:hypothetical protein